MKIGAVPYHRTYDGLTSKIYGDQKKSCLKRGHLPPLYTSKELRRWMHSRPDFYELFGQWVISGYDRMLVPSVDRLNDSLTYSLDNIRLTTWRDNNNKSHADRRAGKLSSTKQVLRYDKEEDRTAWYRSCVHAEETNSISRSVIASRCSGRANDTGRYEWRYA